MSNKNVFKSSKSPVLADTKNSAGGVAYSFADKHALAQYAVTGTFNDTYYSNADDQLTKVLELCKKVPAEYLAKLAIYSREHGKMKDMPSLLTAVLASTDTKLFSKVFPQTIDNSKMLRNFVQMIRSGVTGRKSLGTAPKRLIQNWFSSRTTEQIFKQSIGAKPSLSDVIKLSHPSSKDENGTLDKERDALYKYLLDKEYCYSDLPTLVQEYEAFKSYSDNQSIPKVPFEMLTTLNLNDSQWKEISKNMTWTQLRMNLNTLKRHNAFDDKDVVNFVANKLSDEDEVKKSNVFPYQLLSAYMNAEDVPQKISNALQSAMEIAVNNVPKIEDKFYVCLDVSGSMHSPVTGARGSVTSKVQCIDVAALVAASLLRQGDGEVIAFNTGVVKTNKPLNPFDSIMTNSKVLRSLPSGGTACSAPVKHLNGLKAKADLVVIISDNESWKDFHSSNKSALFVAWQHYKTRNPKAKLVLIDLAPNSTTQVPDQKDVLNIGGFSDLVFNLIDNFINNRTSKDHWVSEIEKIVV